MNIQEEHIDELILRYPALEYNRVELKEAARALIETLDGGGKLLICGNGGSAADADHIVGELMKGFVRPRPLRKELKEALIRAGGDEGRRMGLLLQGGLPAVSLCAHTALNTAFSNDVDPALAFAQQAFSLGNPVDLLWGLSTSGNSSNIVFAAIAARAVGMKTLALTGEKESRLSEIADICIRVQGTETYKIQELHLPVYHALCRILEDHCFGEN